MSAFYSSATVTGGCLTNWLDAVSMQGQICRKSQPNNGMSIPSMYQNLHKWRRRIQVSVDKSRWCSRETMPDALSLQSGIWLELAILETPKLPTHVDQ